MCEVCYVLFESGDDGFCFRIFYGCGQDCISGPVVKNEDGLMLVHGGNGESSGKVGVDGAVFGVYLADG